MDVQPKNLVALLIGSGQFSFADGAETVAEGQAAGYEDFGNITAFSIQSKGTTKEHVGSYNGVRKIDKTNVTEIRVGYQIKCDEASASKMRHFLYGSPGSLVTQSAVAAQAADPLTSPKANVWYNLQIDGVTILKLTTVAITSTPSVIEGTDYVIDYDNGRIRFITTPPGTITSILLTAVAITATDNVQTINPNTTPIRRGMGRLICYDDAGVLAFDHDGFYAEIYPEGNPSFDGTKEAELTLNVNILTPAGVARFYNGN